jgi:hypothetical protein
VREWYPHEDGETIGQRGPEGGRVVFDEELGDSEDPEDADARLTVEADDEGRFRTVANLYGGWLYLIAEGSVAAALKPELERLAALVPDEDDRDVDQKARMLLRELEAMEVRYGS